MVSPNVSCDVHNHMHSSMSCFNGLLRGLTPACYCLIFLSAVTQVCYSHNCLCHFQLHIHGALSGFKLQANKIGMLSITSDDLESDIEDVDLVDREEVCFEEKDDVPSPQRATTGFVWAVPN